MLSIFKQGQHYLNTWPQEAKLGMIFPENRVIKTTIFSQRVMPFIAVFSIVWRQIFAPSDNIALVAAILTAVFALFLPLQGLYWLGIRANRPLEAQSAAYFLEICEKLKKMHEPLPIVHNQPTYQHLAEVLKKAQQRLDRTFWQEI